MSISFYLPTNSANSYIYIQNQTYTATVLSLVSHRDKSLHRFDPARGWAVRDGVAGQADGRSAGGTHLAAGLSGRERLPRKRSMSCRDGVRRARVRRTA